MRTHSLELEPTNLDGFRRTQRLAYDVVTEVASQLSPGVTEREAATRISASLERRAVSHFFHQPFAWFGDRARFAGFRTPLDFFPTSRRLEPGMCAILDVAPIQDSYAADVGYAFSCGPSPETERALAALEEFRAQILASVRAEESLRTLYRRVDERMRELGYENCHRRYPFGVLGHRVEREAHPLTNRKTLFGFGVGAGLGLLAKAASSRLLRREAKWPFWNEDVSEEARAAPGLWAIEPHMGRGDVGVKWEELLVVTESDAYWLDDDVPHVRRWRAAESSPVA